MINRQYNKRCVIDKLQLELVAAGLPHYPDTGARFYYINGDEVNGEWVTTIALYDDITVGEIATADAVVAAHIAIPMPVTPIPVEETQIFTNLAIRDTDPHTSTISTNIGYRVKTLIVTNTLDQAVTKQCQGSRDNSVWFNIGDSFTVLAGTTIYQTCETYFPYVRALASCVVAPTTGSLNMWVEKMGV